VIHFEATAGGVRFRVRVQPRASLTELAGEWQGALRVRVAAPPVEGEANDELIRFLAKRLEIARSNIHVVSGKSGRTKLIQADGIDAALATARLT
jgi:uncharacterized protein (TIGR00251 family)